MGQLPSTHYNLVMGGRRCSALCTRVILLRYSEILNVIGLTLGHILADGSCQVKHPNALCEAKFRHMEPG